MAAINSNLREAVKYAANENQKLMLKDYIESFEHGSVAAHIEGLSTSSLLIIHSLSSLVTNGARFSSEIC